MQTVTDPLLLQEYIDKHIPYRINSMLAHDLIMHRKQQPDYADIKDRCYGDSTVVEPIFEISLVFGRSLLNFLGITYNKKSGVLAEFQPKDDDVTLQSLFPNRAKTPLTDPIVIASHDGLCKVIAFANKSVAHLTSAVTATQANEYDVLPDARMAICRLVLQAMPEIDKTKVWWHSQVHPF